MPNEYFPAAEAQSMARLLHGLVLPFLRHYKGFVFVGVHLGAWLDSILEGRMERVVLLGVPLYVCLQIPEKS